MESEQLGRIGGADLDEALRRKPARDDALGEEHRQHLLQVGHPRSQVLDVERRVHLLLATPAHVVGAEGVYGAGFEPGPQRVHVSSAAQRGLTHKERPVRLQVALLRE